MAGALLSCLLVATAVAGCTGEGDQPPKPSGDQSAYERAVTRVEALSGIDVSAEDVAGAVDEITSTGDGVDDGPRVFPLALPEAAENPGWVRQLRQAVNLRRLDFRSGDSMAVEQRVQLGSDDAIRMFSLLCGADEEATRRAVENAVNANLDDVDGNGTRADGRRLGERMGQLRGFAEAGCANKVSVYADSRQAAAGSDVPTSKGADEAVASGSVIDVNDAVNAQRFALEWTRSRLRLGITPPAEVRPLLRAGALPSDQELTNIDRQTIFLAYRNNDPWFDGFVSAYEPGMVLTDGALAAGQPESASGDAISAYLDGRRP